MKNPIPQYTFYKTKYGSELLIDVVELKYIKRFLSSVFEDSLFVQHPMQINFVLLPTT